MLSWTKTKTKVKLTDQINQKSQNPKADAAWEIPPNGCSTQNQHGVLKLSFTNLGIHCLWSYPPTPQYILHQGCLAILKWTGKPLGADGSSSPDSLWWSVFSLCVKVSGASLWQTVVRESPAFTADLCWAGVAWAQLPSYSLVGHWLLSKIDTCSGRAAKSIYSVLILFNPIHISESEAWQDVRSHTASREIFFFEQQEPSLQNSLIFS